MTSRSITPATAGTSKPRLGTTWDVFRRPRRPPYTDRARDFQTHSPKQTWGDGTFQPRSRTFPNVPNVPKTPRLATEQPHNCHDVDVARPEGDSDIEPVLQYFHETAPADVLETIAWLASQGWRPHFAQGGRSESFGNALVDFTNQGWAIRIVRDRDQWMLDIQKPDWKRPIDLQIIADTIAGKKDWSGALPDPLPKQIPWEIPWRESVPSALAWIASTQDSEGVLKAMQLKRSRSLFP